MIVHSAQRHDVVERLIAGETHIQSWERSAAYDLANRWSRLKHKRAYFWMGHHYEQRMRRALPAAPVWGSFDYDEIAALQRIYGREANESVVTLHIPRSELLLSMYEPWVKYVLEGYCIGDQQAFRPRFACEHSGRVRRASWNSIFDLSSAPKDWQAVFDRIEPTWLVALDGAPVRTQAVH